MKTISVVKHCIFWARFYLSNIEKLIMDKTMPPQAKFWGLGPLELTILNAITYWYNGKMMRIGCEKHNIATHYEPTLEEIFTGGGLNYQEHRDAHERLLKNGFLKEEYICRQKIDWSPTQQGLQAIRENLHQCIDDLRPSWANKDAEGPIFGDPNESLCHRKGVEIAGKMFPRFAWAFDIENHSTPYGVEWYPTDNQGQSCHDLHIDTNEWTTDVGIEVITNSNNRDHLINKWQRLQDEDRITFWIFDKRNTACKLWNELNKRGIFYLDGQFQNYGNWSAKAINRKIWRSSNKFRNEPAGDIVHTVTGLLEGDRDMVQEIFEEYYSTK